MNENKGIINKEIMRIKSMGVAVDIQRLHDDLKTLGFRVEKRLLVSRCGRLKADYIFESRLDRAIKKAKPNMDKIKDVDSYLDNLF